VGVTNGVCDNCGSGVVEATGEHIRNRLECPLSAEFWWENHGRLRREGKFDASFRRNPNDIREALGMNLLAREAIMEAHQAGQRYRNIMQYDAGYEIVISTAIARLLDAGVLQRGPNS
jgi:hypothetical protein